MSRDSEGAQRSARGATLRPPRAAPNEPSFPTELARWGAVVSGIGPSPCLALAGTADVRARCGLRVLLTPRVQMLNFATREQRFFTPTDGAAVGTVAGAMPGAAAWTMDIGGGSGGGGWSVGRGTWLLLKRQSLSLWTSGRWRRHRVPTSA